jgi:hypothetical protein
MVEGIRAACTSCHAVHVVVPPTMGQAKRPSEEPPIVGLPAVGEDEHLVEADIEGRFTCRVCQHENQVPDLNLT